MRASVYSATPRCLVVWGLTRRVIMRNNGRPDNTRTTSLRIRALATPRPGSAWRQRTVRRDMGEGSLHNVPVRRFIWASPITRRSTGKVHEPTPPWRSLRRTRAKRRLGSLPATHLISSSDRPRAYPSRSTTAHASSGTMISWWPVMWKPRPPLLRVGRSTTLTRAR